MHVVVYYLKYHAEEGAFAVVMILDVGLESMKREVNK